MITRAFNFIRGCINSFLIIINMLFHGTLTFIFGCFVWILPPHWPISKLGMRFVLLIPRSWSQFNFWILKLSTFGKWDIQGDTILSRKNWYVMISNHQTWIDILLLGGTFCNNTPPIKFFMKKELIWTLPVAGVCCYLLGYPMMERHTRADIRKDPSLKGKDIETTKQACKKFRYLPTTVINFLEGTRFTQAKHDKQASPYRHLLKPKAGGTAIVMNELHDCLAGVLNVTVNYDTDNLSFFNIMSGNVRKISVYYEVLPITPEILGDYYEDRQYRARLQKWLNELWERKDELLDKLKSHDN
ncbi:MAG: acyltransferase [Coxiella sp. (in: Bacteria)]|nr:MAG: acyltransferase [Coxiella sp. (in: g-proteobacteria)]